MIIQFLANMRKTILGLLFLGMTFLFCFSELNAQKSKAKQRKLFYSALDYIYDQQFEKALDILYHLDTIELGNFLDDKKTIKKKDDTIQLEKIYVKYLIGASYLEGEYLGGDPIPYIEYVINSGYSETPAIVFKDLGTLYHQDYKFRKAKFYFSKYTRLVSKDDEFYPYAKRMLEVCEYASNLTRDTIDYTMKKMSESINTRYSEHSPVISEDGKTLYFMMTVFKEIEGQSEDVIIEKRLMRSNKEFGLWSKSVPIDVVLPDNQTDFNLAGISTNGKIFYLSVGEGFDFDIYECEERDFRCVFKRKLDFINTKYYESRVHFSGNGKEVYFTSNKPGGKGGLDIYRTVQSKPGKWRKPQNLGPVINTRFNEESPFFDEDKKVLYFSSDGHETIGGYDIFKSATNNAGELQKPVNIGFPLNTTRDNIDCAFYYHCNNLITSYSQRDRFDNQDLYDVDLRLNIPVTVIRGIIKGGDNLKPLRANIKLIHKDTTVKKLVNINPTRENGKYYIFCPPGKTYDLFVEAPGYKPQLISIYVPEQTYFYPLYQEILLQPLKINEFKLGEQVVVKNTFYDVFEGHKNSELLSEKNPGSENYQRLVGILEDIITNKEFVTKDQNYTVSDEPTVKKDYMKLLNFVEEAIETGDSSSLKRIQEEVEETKKFSQEYFYASSEDSIKKTQNRIVIGSRQIETAPPIKAYEPKEIIVKEKKPVDYVDLKMDAEEISSETNHEHETSKDSTPEIEESKELTQITRMLYSDSIFFDRNSSIISNTYNQKLEKIANLLIDHSNLNVHIQGYASTPGGEKKNLRLSKERAIQVKNYFANNGIDDQRIIIDYYGETKSEEEQTDKQRQQNRRVNISIFDIGQN
jgi:outer membrane protein OmpA-like peptidoglycan-associated protein